MKLNRKPYIHILLIGFLCYISFRPITAYAIQITPTMPSGDSAVKEAMDDIPIGNEVPDTDAPVISEAKATRMSKGSAELEFSSNEDILIYMKLVPAKDGFGLSNNAVKEEYDILLAYLKGSHSHVPVALPSAGAWDICIVAADIYGNLSVPAIMTAEAYAVPVTATDPPADEPPPVPSEEPSIMPVIAPVIAPVIPPYVPPAPPLLADTASEKEPVADIQKEPVFLPLTLSEAVLFGLIISFTGAGFFIVLPLMNTIIIKPRRQV